MAGVLPPVARNQRHEMLHRLQRRGDHNQHGTMQRPSLARQVGAEPWSLLREDQGERMNNGPAVDEIA
jgi:hypothetical protein